MSFASILSGPAEDRSPKRSSPSAPTASQGPSQAPSSVVRDTQHDRQPAPAAVFPELEKEEPGTENHRPAADNEPGDELSSFHPTNGVSEPTSKPHATRPRKMFSERDIEVINKMMNDIDNADKSDVEGPGFEEEVTAYITKGKKRVLDTDKSEELRRKVCRSSLFLLWEEKKKKFFFNLF